MNKNSEVKKQERLNWIVQTALDLYREKGYQAVSVLDICRACSMTKPTFYKYVPSKEVILTHYFQADALAEHDPILDLDPEDHLGRVFYAITITLRRTGKGDAELLKNYLYTCLKEHYPSCFGKEPWARTAVTEIQKARQSGQIQSDVPEEILFRTLGALALGMGIEYACCEPDTDLFSSFTQKASHFLC